MIGASSSEAKDHRTEKEPLAKPPISSQVQKQVQSCRKEKHESSQENNICKLPLAGVPKETIDLCQTENIVLQHFSFKLLNMREDKENTSDNRSIDYNYYKRSSTGKCEKSKAKLQTLHKPDIFNKRLDEKVIQRIFKYQNDVDVYNNYLKGNLGRSFQF